MLTFAINPYLIHVHERGICFNRQLRVLILENHDEDLSLLYGLSELVVDKHFVLFFFFLFVAVMPSCPINHMAHSV